MNVTENQLESSFIENIQGAASEGAEIFDIDESAPPVEVMSSLNQSITNLQGTNMEEYDIWTDLALPSGSLWGQQFVREFQWEWASVVQHDHDDFKAIGVFNNNRSMCFYPWHFVYGCLANNAPVTLLLAFNMIVEGSKIPNLTKKSYTNIMDHIQHIIPPN